MTKRTTSGQEEKPDNYQWEAGQAETESQTKLEADTGHGQTAIIRQFKFKTNPQTFRNHPPTKQELFNAHLKQIEILLWQDGLKIMTDVEPTLTLSKRKQFYTITVGAIPMRGQMLPHDLQPMTLTEIAHGKINK